MNFLRDRSLKQLGAYLLVLTSLVFIAEYFIIRRKINQLDEAERKIDFARGVQLSSQQLALQLQLYLNGREDLAAEVASRLEHQDYLLKILSDGGRIEGTDHFLQPLSRLPRITFDNLTTKWNEYKRNTFTLLSKGETMEEPAAVEAPADSTALATMVPSAPSPEPMHTGYARSRLRNEGLWLSLANWYDKLVIDLEDEVIGKREAIYTWLIILIVLNIGLLAGVYYLFRRYVLGHLNSISSTRFTSHSNGVAKNEIHHLQVRIDETLGNLKDATDFVTAIGHGNLSVDYKDSLDNSHNRSQNLLADSLVEMQAKLKAMNEEERKRQWANEGLTKFVDILRSSNDNIHALGDRIISTLIQYTGSNQGGLYLLNDEDEHNRHLELIALFAFDIKKFVQQKIKLGEGILGQTFLEKETTYLTDIPEEYVRITSGLGDATPKCILIVPLKIDQEVYGLVELASFREYQPHEITFVEKLGETIASTFGNVRAAQKNRHLIDEFQRQTDLMKSQEEVMRQNMEELQATQEEIVRKERNYQARIQELEEQAGDQTVVRDLETVRQELVRKERDYQTKIHELEKQVAQKPLKADDWELAQEVERTLRINLDALKITREELKSE